MYARFDFVSPETGRVLLSTLLDSPPDALNPKGVSALIVELSRTKRHLESIFGKGQVRVSLDSFESSVFWYLVLFRPIQFSERHPKYAGRKYSVYDVLHEGSGLELQKTNLGLIYDRENNWLALLWDEALGEEGICAGMETCPSWEGILNGYKKRMHKDAPPAWWHQCAECHSWIVPEWRLRKMGYQAHKLWFRTDLTYDKLTVIDLTGLEIIRLEGTGKGLLNEAKLLTARRVRYAHHYTTSDKREFLSMRKTQRALTHAEKLSGTQRAEMSEKQRETRMSARSKINENWRQASYLVGQLCREFGVGKSGRYPKEMKGADCYARYRRVLDRYLNGHLDTDATQTPTVKRLLKELEDVLVDTSIPMQFQVWMHLHKRLEDVLLSDREDT